QVVHQGTRDGAQPAGGGRGDGGHVPEGGERQVLADRGQRLATEHEGGGGLTEVVDHQHDVGGAHRQIGPGCPHGDGHVGGGQGRRVVHPVAHHRHPVPFRP